MNPDTELPHWTEHKLRQQYKDRLSELIEESPYVSTRNIRTTAATTTVNSYLFNDVCEPLNVQLVRKLESIYYCTRVTRAQLDDVEVLDELWDNGAEVVVIRKETLDLVRRLLQEISKAGNS